MDHDRVELSVSKHPSGRYTLIEKSGTARKDLSGPLFANPDKGGFYQAVALYLAEAMQGSRNVSYVDTHD